jgi:serine/threonine protein kinase
MSQNHSLVGKTLRNRYQIHKSLGNGGFGCTYLAYDLDLPTNPICVVKHLQPKNPNPEVIHIAIRLFEREAETLYRLGSEHDQIPHLSANFWENGNFFLVQDYVYGNDLAEEIIPKHPIGEEEVIQLLYDILEVLAFVHQNGVIHRDIKPHNIRRRNDGNIVLIDFGSVKQITGLDSSVLGQDNQTNHTIIGTPGYMPPEQQLSNPQLASDIYAVGIIAFCALTGLSALDLPRNSRGELRCALFPELANLDPGFAEILDKMVHPDYRLRYANASDALQALEILQQRQQQQPVKAEKVSLWQRIVQMLLGLLKSDDDESDFNNLPELKPQVESKFHRQSNSNQNFSPIRPPITLKEEFPPYKPPSLPSTISGNNSSIPTTKTNIYIQRPPIEAKCYEEILYPGALIRIKAPHKMGKTLLLEKLLESSRNHGYRTAKIDLRLAEDRILENYEKFLKWLSVNISDCLEMEEKIDKYWGELFGLNKSCTRYIQNYLLSEIGHPVVLALDNFERLFEYPDIFSQFSLLLRGWYEAAKQGDRVGLIWKKFRLVIVHSTEVLSNLDKNYSPFNVGMSIELPQFNLSQVETFALEYQLLDEKVSREDLVKLIELVGGHPYFIKQAFTNLKNQPITMDEILELASTEEGIYCNYLREQLWSLEQNSLLKNAYKNVVMSDEPVRVNSEVGFKLQSLGLVKLTLNNCLPSCRLYRLYFREHL